MKYLFTLTCVLCSVLFSNGQTRYVTQVGSGTKDGTSWANAWDSKIFADTINTVSPGTSIWMAKGNYRPTKDSLGQVVMEDQYHLANRERTFRIPTGVKLYGGFVGTELSIDQRDPSLRYSTNASVFDGSHPIEPFATVTNSWELVTLVDASAGNVVDGFYIFNYSRDGILIRSTANSSSSPIINNVNFGPVWSNAEGAIAITTWGTVLSKPKISNCIFNYYDFSQLYPIKVAGNCRPEISNCLFSKKTGDPGLTFNCKGATITNCTFYTYAGPYTPRAVITIANLSDSLYMNNCIFWFGTPGGSPDNAFAFGKSSGNNFFSLRNSCLKQQTWPSSVTPAYESGSITINPQFVDTLDINGADNIFGTADDGLRLKNISPCIDLGINDSIPAIAVTDIIGNNRVSGCKVDLGAYEYQIPNSNIIVLPQSSVPSCTQYPIPDSATTFIDPATCLVSASVNPVGVNPVSGIMQVCVVTNTTVPVVNGVPYVQRHYDIEPLTNGATTTARITVYYTQQEFDNYNAVATTFPQLPTSPSDVAGKANVRIEQDHGISLTGVPGTYNGTTVYINPDDNDILWNSTSNIWEVSFNVTGFSGFFLTTSFGPLPVTLVSFSGQENGNSVKLKWKTTAEYSFRSFDVEKSNDGINFRTIQNVNASGDVNGHEYSVNDLDPYTGKNFYRLKMIDIDGTFKYSSVVLIKYQHDAVQSFNISPNPAGKTTTISITGNLSGDANILMYDSHGSKISDVYLGKLNTRSYSTDIDLSRFKPGVYILYFITGKFKKSEKLVIQ